MGALAHDEHLRDLSGRCGVLPIKYATELVGAEVQVLPTTATLVRLTTPLLAFSLHTVGGVLLYTRGLPEFGAALVG